jgi:hypothetical protein
MLILLNGPFCRCKKGTRALPRCIVSIGMMARQLFLLVVTDFNHA